jgi:hypothetical protein
LLVCGIPAAFADTPPSVQTLKLVNMSVTDSSDTNVPETLQGVVNPGGGNCTVYFWDLYLYFSNLPQANIAGWVEDGYVKINSLLPRPLLGRLFTPLVGKDQS